MPGQPTAHLELPGSRVEPLIADTTHPRSNRMGSPYDEADLPIAGYERSSRKSGFGFLYRSIEVAASSGPNTFSSSIWMENGDSVSASSIKPVDF